MRFLVVLALLIGGCATPAPPEPTAPAAETLPWHTTIPATSDGTVHAYILDVPAGTTTLRWSTGAWNDGIDVHGPLVDAWFIAWFELGSTASLYGAELEYPATVWKGLVQNAPVVSWENASLYTGNLESSQLGVLVGAKGDGVMGLELGMAGLPSGHQEPAATTRGWATELYVDVAGGATVHLGGGTGLRTEGIEVTSATDGVPVDRHDVRHETLRHRSDLSGWSQASYDIVHRPQAGQWATTGDFQSIPMQSQRIVGPLAGTPNGNPTDPLLGRTGFDVTGDGGGIDLEITRTIAGINTPGNVVRYQAFVLGDSLDNLLGVPAETGITWHDPYAV